MSDRWQRSLQQAQHVFHVAITQSEKRHQCKGMWHCGYNNYNNKETFNPHYDYMMGVS